MCCSKSDSRTLEWSHIKVTLLLWSFPPPQVRAAESQINQLIEKRMMRSEPMDDKLTLYRQQVQWTVVVQ